MQYFFIEWNTLQLPSRYIQKFWLALIQLQKIQLQKSQSYKNCSKNMAKSTKKFFI